MTERDDKPPFDGKEFAPPGGGIGVIYPRALSPSEMPVAEAWLISRPATGDYKA